MEKQIDFGSPAHVYFIGIGGISMSGLAKILQKKGFKISGSDLIKTDLTLKLEEEGMHINYSQKAENISSDIDYVIYTAAIRKDNEEFLRAKELKLPLINRAVLLGEIMDEFKNAIAISGTHGKTTTTSMLTHILLEAQKDPTISVGGILPIIGGNIKTGSDDIFITEACEYTNSFLDLNPRIEVILNIEEDHLDFFKDLADIRASFKKFIDKLDESGVLVIDSSIEDYKELLKDYKGKLIKVGKDSADFLLKNIDFNSEGFVSFEYESEGEIKYIELGARGEHNVYNALAAIAVAVELGVDFESIKNGLAKFSGAMRRFEKKGDLFGKIAIVDDYAHHPAEIKATLKAAAKYPAKRTVCVFQPHTYSRTKALLNDFASSLAAADIIVLAKIYAAREKDDLGISSYVLAELIKEQGKEVYCFDTFDEIEDCLLEILQEGDLCITMGAGDIVKVGERLLGN